MIETVLTLPAHFRRRLVKALDSGMLGMKCTPVSLKAAIGLSEGNESIVSALAEFDKMGITARAAAAWIRSLEQHALKTPRPDLVWSGPEVPGVHARDTRRVYEELLGSAERSVWISTFVYFDGPRAFEVLADRMDEKPDLRVTLLINIQRRRGDLASADEVVRRFTEKFWGKDWPGSSRPTVYYDPRSLELNGPGSVLHAKAVIIDDEALFVTSANLTEAALDRNFELGLLVRERTLALSCARHFQGLIDRGKLCLLPND